MSGVGEANHEVTPQTALRSEPQTPHSSSREAGSPARHGFQDDQQVRLPLVLTVEEAADRLGVGRTVMYALVSSGAVESVRIGRLRRVPADALVAFLDALRDCQRGGAA
jgi:excisionase family DNA binding protein